MDSYFASVEQQFNQSLVGKPVGVIKAEGRTCIIAASREAKKFGVKTGCNIWDAKTLCPKIALVSAHFGRYFSVTKKFIKICENFSPYIEIFSIDELFMDVTESQKFFGGVLNMCNLIKKQINKQIGEYITCTIGISYNRLLAKLASEINKPNGIFEINKQNRDETLFAAKLTDICGLGFRLEKRLGDMGIKNLETLRNIPIEFLSASFGPFWSVHLKNLSYGEDNTNLNFFSELQDAKSISRTFTLFDDTCDERKIKQTLRNLCEEVGYKLRKMKMETRQLGLLIRGNDLSEKIHHTFKTYTSDSDEIFKNIWELFNRLNWQNSVRFLGVWVGLLEKTENLSLSIFPEQHRKDDYWQTIDNINDRWGGFTIYPASLLGGELIRPEVNGFLGDKKYQLSQITNPRG